MGAEIGATTSLFAYDDSISRYLKATGREALADAANSVSAHLRADDEVEIHPEGFFDQVIHIDLSALSPHINGPHTPDLSRPLAELGAEATANGWPLEVSAGLIGSCTNSSYEDITRAAGIARDAVAKGLTAKGAASDHARLRAGQGHDRTRRPARRLRGARGNSAGQRVRSVHRPVGPSGPSRRGTQLNRHQLQPQLSEAHDGYATTHAFVTSPETVIALTLAGRLDFDPANDTLLTDAGEEVRLSVGPGEELPAQGFDPGADTFQAPPPDGSGIEVVVSPTSERLQMLTPFPAWDGKDLTDLPVLVKAQGKCTTDHISMAGPWLRYRGHLENISGNVYMGAVNAHGGEVGIGLDVTDGERRPYPEIAKRYHEAGIAWVAIGDENMGEGSSREHAAMEPRFRGARAVIARSFARIHETNLKKQGILPLTFDDPADYGLVGERDLISVNGLADLAPGAPVDVLISHEDGTSTRILTQHTYSHDQVLWFHAGSALNLIRAQTRG